MHGDFDAPTAPGDQAAVQGLDPLLPNNSRSTPTGIAHAHIPSWRPLYQFMLDLADNNMPYTPIPVLVTAFAFADRRRAPISAAKRAKV